MTSKRHEATTDRGAGPEGERSRRAGKPPAQLADLLEMKKQELIDAAGKLGLKGVTKLPKAELARRILTARGTGTTASLSASQEARPSARSRPATGMPPAEAAAAPATEAGGARPGIAEPESPRPPPPDLGAGAVPAERPSPAATARLDLGPGASREPREQHIPWSYDQDRVTAMAVDPQTLYAYWEVTDPGLDRARNQLGAAAEGAWLALRVHDTTGLIFDGTNAHSYFDHGVSRSDRQWFFTIGKPSSSAVVEVGLRSPGGGFVRIARSSRVDFPRSSPAPWSDPEWMTVLAGGEVVPAGRGAPAHPVSDGGPAQTPVPSGERHEHVPVWILLEPGEGERRFRELFGEAFERIEWKEMHGGEGWYELQGRLEWQVGPMMTSWEAGPFTYPVEVEPPSRETWEGGAIAYTANGVTRVVYGPWRVVIRNLGGRTERAVLGQWQIYRSWATRGGLEEVQRVATRVGGAPGGASERLAGSAWLWQVGSEMRLGGASELWRMGASEVRLAGASEVLLAGASERRLAGASERGLAGASEWRLRGASERRLGGASERQLGGASERRLGGASERRLGGASERQGGATGGGPNWPRKG